MLWKLISELQRVGAAARSRAGAGPRLARLSRWGSTGRSDAVITSTATQTVRAGRDGFVGGCVGVLLVWRTGLLSAAPAAMGLTMLAASDMATRRVPKTIVAHTTACMLAAALADAIRLSEMDRFLAALGLATLVGFVAGLAWLVSSGIAFGDVKLLALAAFVPAWLRGSAVVTVVAVAFLAAAVNVLVERLRHGHITAQATIAFGPPLLVGWLVGVLTA